jgi:Mg2+ and Co2+ transporter CorA
MKSFKSSRDRHRLLRDLLPQGWSELQEFLQADRTLDEAYYPSLEREILEKRNADQVVTNKCRRLLDQPAIESIPEASKPILVVSQLCIWSFSDYVLSIYSDPGDSSFHADSPNRDPYSHRDPYSYRSATSNWVLGELGQMELDETECKIAIVGLLIARQIGCFGEPQFVAQALTRKGWQSIGRYQSPLDIFEIGVVRVLSVVSDYMLSANKTKVDMDKEASFIHDISDIRSELAMIDEILIQQQQVLSGVMENTPPFPCMAKAHSQLERYRERVTKIDKDAERIEKTIQDQLTLKRTHASMKDARASVILGTAVIGFTIITIVFAPIAFIASLFALPISNLVKHQEKVGDANVYPSSYVAGWFGEYHLPRNVYIH